MMDVLICYARRCTNQNDALDKFEGRQFTLKDKIIQRSSMN